MYAHTTRVCHSLHFFPQETLKEERVAILEHAMTCLKVHQFSPLRKKKNPGSESKIIIQKDLKKKKSVDFFLCNMM